MGTIGQILKRPRLLHMERPRLVVSPLRPRVLRLMTLDKADRQSMGNPAGLTHIELEILVWCANGKRLADIGILMEMKPDRARQISFRMRTKLGAQTLAGAVAIALRRRIIE